MDILNSDWLITMLKKSGATPHARMLSLFDILHDWLAAPGISVSWDAASTSGKLQNYLTQLATEAGASQPEMLAMQLYLIALSACKNTMEASSQPTATSNTNLDYLDALIHAKHAASALITAQTEKEPRWALFPVHAIAASLICLSTVGGMLYFYQYEHAKNTQSAIAFNAQPILAMANNIANPEETAALIAQIDLMRKGSCQLPEALQLPDSYKKVYFENIVSGQISTDPNDQKLVRELLQKVRCNYTPMLMANSTG